MAIYLIVAVLGCVVALLAYRESESFRTKNGVTPWRMPSWAWAIIGFGSLLVCGVLLAIARRTTERVGLSGPPGSSSAEQMPVAEWQPDSVGQPSAGWYADPAQQGGQRYFDGTAWTDPRVDAQGVAAPLWNSAPVHSLSRKVTWRRVVGAVGLAALIVMFAVGTWSRTRVHTVGYQVTGTATQADITYSRADGSTGQQRGIDVPLVMKATGQLGMTVRMHVGHHFDLSARNATNSGDITCSVTVDGRRVVTQTSSGRAGITDCEGSIG